MEEILKIDTVDQYNKLFGFETRHPQVGVVSFDTAESQGNYRMTMGFYSVFLKETAGCRINYGKTSYDFDDQTVICIAPGQTVGYTDVEGIPKKSVGLLFHPDFIRGTSLGQKIKKYTQGKAGDDFMKKIVLALTFVLVGSFMLAGCSKDEILNHYNNIVQSAGSIELTGKSSLQGEKEKGIDDYTGTYTADYANFSGTEYLFGGTSIKREAGKELSIDCTLEIMEGTAKVFWISGSDEAVTLIEATGTYSDTITLPDGGNYIGIE